MKRIELQAVVQKYVTHSISSTINLPAEVSMETVGEIYLESSRNGLKGITVSRWIQKRRVAFRAGTKRRRLE